MISTVAFALILFVATGIDRAEAGFSIVDLSAYANQDIRQGPYSNGSNLPVGGTSITVGDTPFVLSTLNGMAGTTGIVQAGNAGGPNLPSSVDVAVSISGALEVRTLINSAYGTLGAISGTVQFFGTGGAFVSFDLVQGVNIRDYNNNVFFNNAIAPGTNTIEFANGQTHLDEQIFVLPSSFRGQTLTGIRLTSLSNSLFDGEPFLTAVTALSVPEPSSLVLTAIALTLGVGHARSRVRRPGKSR